MKSSNSRRVGSLRNGSGAVDIDLAGMVSRVWQLALLLSLLTLPLTESQAAGKLIFKSNFGPGVSVTERWWSSQSSYWPTLSGTDATTGYSWDDLWDSEYFRAVTFQYVSNKPYENSVTTEIRNIPGPTGANTSALYMEVKQDDPTHGGLTRNELQLRPQYGLNPNQMYVKYWMKLDDNYLSKLPSSQPWNDIWEFKEPTDDNFRVTLYIDKYGSRNTPFWNFMIRESGNVVRSEINDSVAIPYDQWFLVEIFYRYADAPNGRFYFAVNGKVVFDYEGFLKHRTNSYNRIEQISVFKNYRWTDWFENQPVYHRYAGLELWTDFPDSVGSAPGTPSGVSLQIK